MVGLAVAPSAAGGTSDRRRSWLRRHEEGALYALAAVLYIPLGVVLKTVVLNWIVGPLFPLLVVYVVPTFVRRRRGMPSP